MIRILATGLITLSLTASGAFATSMGDLTKTDGLYYENFTVVPFTGGVDEGVYQGAALGTKTSQAPTATT
jgi:hypothetical protein